MKRLPQCVPLAFCALLASASMAQNWSLRDEAPQGLDQLYYERDRNQVVGFTTFPAAMWVYHDNQWGRQQLAMLPVVNLSLVLLCGYDEQRREAILVAPSPIYPPGYRTYRSVPGGWVHAGNGAPARPQASVAYDSTAGRLLVFGGLDLATSAPTADLYAWNGSAWSVVPVSATPPARAGGAMAFDRARNRLVLFGGSMLGGSVLDDTWEFDGVQWQQFAVTGPAPRQGSMVYDETTQRVVLLGGFDPTIGWLSDSWSWTGSQWQPRPNLPPSASGQGWGDPTGIHVLVGGDVWRSAAGGAWTLQSTADIGLQTYRPALAFDPTRGEVLAAGGRSLGATWAWNGRWRQVAAAANGPGERYGTAMAPLGTDMILFGGMLPPMTMVTDTWRWNGTSWTMLLPNHNPPARNEHALVYDGQRVLLFGGNGASGPMNDLWAFDGVDWTQLTSAIQPGPRGHHGFAYDIVRQRAVVHGGWSWMTTWNDTWEWDGAQWTNVPTTAQPVRSYTDDIVFDAGRGRVVACRPGELWEWTGLDWTLTATPLGADPTAYSYVYDPVGDRLLSHSPSTYVLGRWSQGVAQTAIPCGNLPGLSVHGNLVPDHTARLHVESVPGVVAAMALGLQPASVFWSPSCEQGVQVATSVFGLGDAGGVWDLPLSIPNDLALRGVSLHAQALVLDGGPVYGASFSRAIRLVVGD
jgi:hypothetical protein